MEVYGEWCNTLFSLISPNIWWRVKCSDLDWDNAVLSTSCKTFECFKERHCKPSTSGSFIVAYLPRTLEDDQSYSCQQWQQSTISQQLSKFEKCALFIRASWFVSISLLRLPEQASRLPLEMAIEYFCIYFQILMVPTFQNPKIYRQRNQDRKILVYATYSFLLLIHEYNKQFFDQTRNPWKDWTKARTNLCCKIVLCCSQCINVTVYEPTPIFGIHSCVELYAIYKVEPMHVFSFVIDRMLKKCLVKMLNDPLRASSSVKNYHFCNKTCWQINREVLSSLNQLSILTKKISSRSGLRHYFSNGYPGLFITDVS